MGQVSKKINGRTYRLSCDDGEEQRLSELLAYVDTHTDKLTEQFGQIGEDRLMMMAAIKIADELWDLRDELEANAQRARDQLKELAAKGESFEKGGVFEDEDDTDADVTSASMADDISESNAILSMEEEDANVPSDGMDIGIDEPPQKSRKKRRAYR